MVPRARLGLATSAFSERRYYQLSYHGMRNGRNDVMVLAEGLEPTASSM